MNIEDFVKESLGQIFRGVQGAATVAQATGATIDPRQYGVPGTTDDYGRSVRESPVERRYISLTPEPRTDRRLMRAEVVLRQAPDGRDVAHIDIASRMRIRLQRRRVKLADSRASRT